jgi:hypothetical protein
VVLEATGDEAKINSQTKTPRYLKVQRTPFVPMSEWPAIRPEQQDHPRSRACCCLVAEQKDCYRQLHVNTLWIPETSVEQEPEVT